MHTCEMFISLTLPRERPLEDSDVAGKSTSGRLTNWRYQKGKPGEPVAVRTMIGWTLMGPTKPDPTPGIKESVNLVIDTSHSVREEATPGRHSIE